MFQEKLIPLGILNFFGVTKLAIWTPVFVVRYVTYDWWWSMWVHPCLESGQCHHTRPGSVQEGLRMASIGNGDLELSCSAVSTVILPSISGRKQKVPELFKENQSF